MCVSLCLCLSVFVLVFSLVSLGSFFVSFAFVLRFVLCLPLASSWSVVLSPLSEKETGFIWFLCQISLRRLKSINHCHCRIRNIKAAVFDPKRIVSIHKAVMHALRSSGDFKRAKTINNKRKTQICAAIQNKAISKKSNEKHIFRVFQTLQFCWKCHMRGFGGA